MAVDVVQVVHSSPVVQKIEAVENAGRNARPPDPEPKDQVSVSDAARARSRAGSE